ncbi:ATP-grasp domain-containing protein [Parachitinimonas caeni]|uniref:ATP-grasp domain-containing protein n=1 Tax=Parachitinimonas caeni TaxID=3031301 RepID=A0ABT7E248_9NEIS|nr:ATP-grasp domain-containing protein [Parachitinimonas caeni]MDK2126391.1 ATP-grasp domain-containing protein [Parachitinimonas caeni]
MIQTCYLITGIGGDIAQNTARIVREVRPHARIIGSDLHERHAGRLFVDACYCLPPATAPDYLPALRALLAEQAVSHVLPMTEPELNFLAGLPTLPEGVQWFLCGAAAIRAGVDKLDTTRQLLALGIDMPWTVPVAEGALEYPCMLKPRRGSGSRGVFKIEDASDAAYHVRKSPDAVFQQLLEPAEREVTCAIFRARSGEVRVLQLQRRLIGGLTGWAETIHDPAVEALCGEIAEKLDIRGCCNVQLRRTDAGPKVFEINPRISSTALMRHLLGFCDVQWWLDDADGQLGKDYQPIPAGREVVRVFDAAVLR